MFLLTNCSLETCQAGETLFPLTLSGADHAAVTHSPVTASAIVSLAPTPSTVTV